METRSASEDDPMWEPEKPPHRLDVAAANRFIFAGLAADRSKRGNEVSRTQPRTGLLRHSDGCLPIHRRQIGDKYRTIQREQRLARRRQRARTRLRKVMHCVRVLSSLRASTCTTSQRVAQVRWRVQLTLGGSEIETLGFGDGGAGRVYIGGSEG